MFTLPPPDLTYFDLGYQYYPLRPCHPAGYPYFAFNLYDDPTLAHFDPSHATLHVRNLEGGVDTITISHPWRGVAVLPVVVGCIALADRTDEKVEVFTFGGQLRIANKTAKTTCLLSAPVPILPLDDDNKWEIAEILAEEAAGELAVMRTRFLAKEAEYYRRLAALDPLALYAAIIAVLREKYMHLPVSGNMALLAFGVFLQGEHKRLQAQSSDSQPIPTLSELF